MPKPKTVESENVLRPLKNNPTCSRCPLYKKSYTVCCPSRGPENSPIFFVGEALGGAEDEMGRPFVGDSGRKLNYIFSLAGIHRKDVRIGNTVRCRPPKNATPSKIAQTSCYPYLLYDILKGRPKVIVALGGVAMNALIDSGNKRKILVDDSRGFPVQQTYSWKSKTGKIFSHTCWIVPTHHPARCLHDWRFDKQLLFDVELAKSLSEDGTGLHRPDTRTVVHSTVKSVLKLCNKLKRVGTFVVDLETSGLDPHESEVLCLGFCYEEGKAHIIPIYKQGLIPAWKTAERREITEALVEVFTKCKIIGQNIKFDIKHLRHFLGINHYNIEADTMVLHHILDENSPHNLTYLAQTELRWEKYDLAMKPWLGRFQDAPDVILWKYCGFDVDATWRLYRKLSPRIKEENLSKVCQIETNLTNVLADVEYRGVRIDTEKMNQLQTEYVKKSEAIKRKLQKIAVSRCPHLDDFNPASPKQVIELLSASGAALKRRTKGGALSSDKYVLADLALRRTRSGTVARMLINLREYNGFVSKYLCGMDGEGGFKKFIKSKDRIHPEYNIARTRTGRLSAVDPPLQTMPKKGGARQMIIPDAPGHVFLSVDYGKAELCTIAWLANDSQMCRELNEGIDLHTRMAITKRLNRDPTDAEYEKLKSEISGYERSLAKAVNFGVIYGIKASSIVEANPDAFANNLNRFDRIDSVQKIIDAYFKKYSGVKRFQEHQAALNRRRGWLRTKLIGRIRRLVGTQFYLSKWGQGCGKVHMDLNHLDNEAMNFGVQSLASDYLSLVTHKCYEGIRKAGIPTLRIVITLHDQLVFNVNQKYVEDVIPLVKEWMQFVLPKTKVNKFRVAVKLDTSIHTRWGLKIDGRQEY